MKKHLFAAVFALLACGFQARAQAPVSMPDDIPPPPADKAQIVFLKPGGGMWAGLQVGVLEVGEQDRELLGVLGEDARLVVDVEPGKHRFMSHLQPVGHFLDADVEAGKRYFVLARFLYGQGFQLRPIRPGTESDFSVGNADFPKWLEGTRVRPVNKAKVAWYARKQDKLAKVQARTEQVWLRKTDAERAELTLRASDAI